MSLYPPSYLNQAVISVKCSHKMCVSQSKGFLSMWTERLSTLEKMLR